MSTWPAVIVNVIVCRRGNYNQFIDRLDINSDAFSLCSNGLKKRDNYCCRTRGFLHQVFFLLPDLGPTIPSFPIPPLRLKKERQLQATVGLEGFFVDHTWSVNNNKFVTSSASHRRTFDLTRALAPESTRICRPCHHRTRITILWPRY